MTRYALDKLLRQVILDDQACRAFLDERPGVLHTYDLSDAECEALEALDYPRLYVLGAHPFLLNGFLMRTQTGDRASALAASHASRCDARSRQCGDDGAVPARTAERFFGSLSRGRTLRLN